VPENRAQEIISISESFGVEAQIVGRVEVNEGKRLTIKSAFGVFEY
jgi:phosphoribosylformylglycinamidine cyclo-ligase